ncbi:heparin lyase I family protein [Paucibacter soli]|uniref:heparin lyase I family protein n=1 Tax=Paucibacter soli TaxID=3133433 RepID=UPI00309A2AAC
MAADWLSALPSQQKRIEPAHCSQHIGAPLFSWGDPRNQQTGSGYTLQVRPLGGAVAISRSGLTEPRARLAQALAPGEYEWSVSYTASTGVAQSSQWRSFSVGSPDGQVRAQDLPDGTQLAAQVAARARPRMLAVGSSFESLRSAAQQPEHLPALTLLRKRANAALAAAEPTPPAATAATPVTLAQAQALAALLLSARTERQHIEHLAVIGRLDGNASLIAAAKRRLLALAAWSPNGSTGAAQASEANGDIALALAQGLDLLWNDLSAAERSQLSGPLRERLLQGSAALALLDREPYTVASLLRLRQITPALLLCAGLPGFPEAQSLLAKAWELNRHSFYTWGYDGNQGPAVAQAWTHLAANTGMAAAVRTISGVNLYELAVLRRSAEQLIAFTPAGQPLPGAFGDDAEARSLYDNHAAALRLHAQQSRDIASIWYWQAKSDNLSNPADASIWQLLLLGVDRGALPVGSASLANDWYSAQAGLAAMHSDIRRADRTSVYFRSSRFGAHGAAQAEQNALAYVSRGLPLLVNAGYTPFPGSPHHRNTRATRFKNALSFDGGFGQAESAAGAARPTDPLSNMDAGGSLIRAQSVGNYAAVTGDATLAYRAVDTARNAWVPQLSNAIRSVVMDKANGLTFVYDWATSATPRQWELNYHAPNSFIADAATVRSSNGAASVCLDRHGPATQFTQTAAWEVPPEVAQAAPSHGRFSTLTRSAEFAHLTVLREDCRNVPLQVSQSGAKISVLVNGRDALQFERSGVSLPSATGATPTVAVTAVSSLPSTAAAGDSATGAGNSSSPSPEAAAQAALVQQPLVNVQAVNKSDIAAELNSDAGDPNAANWSGINCYGEYGNWSRFMPKGIHGSSLPDGSTLRFGLVSDTLNPARKVFALRVHKDDVLTSGAKRCEVLAPGAGSTSLPVGKDFWFAFAIRIVEGAVTSGDDQLLMQWHADGVPFLSLLVKDGRLRIENRFNANAQLTAANTTLVTPWRDSVVATDRWMHFVVKARISPFEKDQPYISMWRNGTPLFERRGPLGINSSTPPFAKLGFYHWLNINTWDSKVPVRTIHLRHAVTVLDPNARYNESTLRAMVF